MATKRRPWPNAAREARDEAAQLIQEAVTALRPLQEERPILREEIYVRTYKAEARLQRALRWLESVEACTKP
jgi:hypothetical protein